MDWFPSLTLLHPDEILVHFTVVYLVIYYGMLCDLLWYKCIVYCGILGNLLWYALWFTMV